MRVRLVPITIIISMETYVGTAGYKRIRKNIYIRCELAAKKEEEEEDDFRQDAKN